MIFLGIEVFFLMLFVIIYNLTPTVRGKKDKFILYFTILQGSQKSNTNPHHPYKKDLKNHSSRENDPCPL